jgi:hypothetical protein
MDITRTTNRVHGRTRIIIITSGRVTKVRHMDRTIVIKEYLPEAWQHLMRQMGASMMKSQMKISKTCL